MDSKTANAVIAIIARNRIETDPSLGKTVANLLLNDVFALFGDKKTDIEEVKVLRPDFLENFSDICFVKSLDLITAKHARTLIALAWDEPYIDLCSYLIKSELLKEADSSELNIIIDNLLNNNTKLIEQIKVGKTNLIGFFVGQTMKAVQGKGNPVEIKELIMNALREKGAIE